MGKEKNCFSLKITYFSHEIIDIGILTKKVENRILVKKAVRPTDLSTFHKAQS